MPCNSPSAALVQTHQKLRPAALAAECKGFCSSVCPSLQAHTFLAQRCSATFKALYLPSLCVTRVVQGPLLLHYVAVPKLGAHAERGRGFTAYVYSASLQPCHMTSLSTTKLISVALFSLQGKTYACTDSVVQGWHDPVLSRAVCNIITLP